MKTVLLLFAIPLWAGISRSPGGATCLSHPCTFEVTCPTSTCPAAEIQQAINEAQLGDTVKIEAGVTWTTSSGITLYRKTSGSGVLTIRSSTDDTLLPAPGTRITPLYKSLLPELRLTNPSSRVLAVEQSSNAVENYRLLGIWFSTAEGLESNSDLIRLWVGASTPEILRSITGATNDAPIKLSMSSTSGLAEGDHVMVFGINGNAAANGWWTIRNPTATTVELEGAVGNGAYISGGSLYKMSHWDPAQTPNNISFDRCLFMPPPLSVMRKAMSVAGRNITIANSYCENIKNQNDSQCISMPSTPGPVTITNNFLGGGPGETILTGGAIPTLPNQNATDLTITHNSIYKDPALYKYEAWSPDAWVRKGKVIKGGNGYNYIATTSGMTGSELPVFTQASCGAPPICSGECCVQDGSVTWQRNWFANAKWTMKNLLEFKTVNRATVKWNLLSGAWPDGQIGVALSIKAENQGGAGDWTAHAEHVEFAHNVVRNTAAFAGISSLGDAKDGVMSDINIHDNLVIGLQGAGSNPIIRTTGRRITPPYLSGLRIVHNTIERAPDASSFWVAGTGSAKFESPVITDNLFDVSGTPYPLICFACPSNAMRKTALDNVSVGSYTFTSNVLSGENLFSWPAGNHDTAWNSIGFTNKSLGNYRLKNGSAHSGAGTDGRDLGADITNLPMINDLSLSATDRMALVAWNVTEPISEIPCVIEVSTDRDFSAYLADIDPSQYRRPDTSDNDRVPKNGLSRHIILGANAPLERATQYWYRLHCGAALQEGAFTTLGGLTGETAFNVSKRRTGGAAGFRVEWGTSYSRSADLISGGGTVQATCGVRDVCTATFRVPSGGIAYYRVHDTDSEGAVLNTGPVIVRAAGGAGF